MLPYVVFGASYGLAAAVQPGQLQAYLVSRAISHGWRRTLPAALAPLLSDVPPITLVLLVLSRVPPVFLDALRLVGGCFLLYLAFGALRASSPGSSAGRTGDRTPRRTFFEAVGVNVFNPNPYLAWALVLGPLLLQAWGESAAAGAALLAAFYTTLVGGSAATVVLFAMARSLGPRVSRPLAFVSAAALAAFGVYQLWVGIAGLA
jgi:threonine/homoserine/homoserine lactone efflux protein